MTWRILLLVLCFKSYMNDKFYHFFKIKNKENLVNLILKSKSSGPYLRSSLGGGRPMRSFAVKNLKPPLRRSGRYFFKMRAKLWRFFITTRSFLAEDGKFKGCLSQSCIRLERHLLLSLILSILICRDVAMENK